MGFIACVSDRILLANACMENSKNMSENEIGTTVIAAAIEVHRELGPGLMESVYEVALAHELELRGLIVRRQVPVPIRYKSIFLEEGFPS